jgi:menaquinone-dependent protoporphyrinogen oxidase
LVQFFATTAAPKSSILKKSTEVSNLPNKTLIAYVTKGGATREAARKIADVLCAKFNLEVEVVDLKKQKMPDLNQFNNVIVGGGVRFGRVYSKAVEFLKNDFSGKKVAFYVCSSWAGTPTPESYKNAKNKFVENTLAKCKLTDTVSSEAFGGRIRYIRKTMVDNTDLTKVEAWAEQLGKKFTK